MSDRDSPARSVYIWVCEGTWRAAVDAALRLAPPGSRFTLLHVTSEEVPDAARGAYAGLLGRWGRDPGTRLAEATRASAARLLQEAAARLRQGTGQACDQVTLQGRAERVVVAASAQADLLIVARDGDQAHPGPRSLAGLPGSSWTMRPARSCWSGRGSRRASPLFLPLPRHITLPLRVGDGETRTRPGGGPAGYAEPGGST